MEKIDIDVYKRVTIRNIQEIQSKIDSNLGNEIFDIKSKEELYYKVLSQFKQFEVTLRKDKKSIKEHIQLLLKKFNLDGSRVKITDLTKNKKITPKIDIYEVFEFYFVGYSKLPSKLVSEIKEVVEKDLVSISALIEHYESTPDIIRYKKGKLVSGRKKLIDFYKRSIEQQRVILNYYLKGVYPKAREKSKAIFMPRVLSLFHDLLNVFDFPYQYRIDNKSFDYRLIDCVSHRLYDFYIDDIPNYEKLYINDRAKFYNQYFKHRNAEDIFENINNYLSDLVLENNRSQIFNELKQVFKDEKWYSFYALALPQVEGLFNEMQRSTDLSRSKFAGLSQKVNSIRPFSNESAFHFDYYEYILPEKRNSFSHTGFIEDVKTASYDILTDLEHITRVFNELKHPSIQIGKIIKREKVEDFQSYKDYILYFKLIQELKVKRKSDIGFNSSIENFNLKFLKQKDTELIYKVNAASFVFGNKIQEIKSKLPIKIDKNEKEIADKLNEQDKSYGLVNEIKSVVDFIHLYEGLQKEIYIDKKSDILYSENILHVWESNKKDAYKLKKVLEAYSKYTKTDEEIENFDYFKYRNSNR